jgi:hypothetical protein
MADPELTDCEDADGSPKPALEGEQLSEWAANSKTY